jgi:phenylalanyl-tRNA synthetase beta chain
VEHGAAFFPTTDSPGTEKTFIHGIREEQHLCTALTGNATPHKNWDAAERPFDFYDAKGILESVVNVCGFADAVIAPAQNLSNHALFSANCVELLVGGTVVGVAGEISREALKMFDLETPVFAAVINLSRLQTVSATERKYAAVSPYPTVQRDLAFVLDTSIDAGLVKNTILKSANEILREVRIFDVFQGKHAVQTIGEGKKSVAFALEFNSFEKTLEDADVETNIKAIVQNVQKEFGATLRG